MSMITRPISANPPGSSVCRYFGIRAKGGTFAEQIERAKADRTKPLVAVQLERVSHQTKAAVNAITSGSAEDLTISGLKY